MQDASKDLGYMRRDIRQICLFEPVDSGMSDMCVHPTLCAPNVCAWNAYYITILPRRHVDVAMALSEAIT
jgi:hypothetical protein